MFASEQKIEIDQELQFSSSYNLFVLYGPILLNLNRTPRLNGQVKRSHRADERELYQLLTYTDDVDLNKKIKIWEDFYNFHRPHGPFKRKIPYEVLKARISAGQNLHSVV